VPVPELKETAWKKRNEIPLCCIYSNQCLHLNDTGRENTILERFLGDDIFNVRREGMFGEPQCLPLEEDEAHHGIFSLLQKEADHHQKPNTTL